MKSDLEKLIANMYMDENWQAPGSIAEIERLARLGAAVEAMPDRADLERDDQREEHSRWLVACYHRDVEEDYHYAATPLDALTAANRAEMAPSAQD